MIDRELELEPGMVREALATKRFLAQDRVKVGIEEIATWDRFLLRETRLLVPVDLQALFVPEGDTEPMVRLPMALAAPEEVSRADQMPAPFDPGTPRPSGVHLHWAMPDALLRGRLNRSGQVGTNKLGLPVLPDRWVVLRLLYPGEAVLPEVTGWALEADRALAVPLAEWSEGGAAATGAKATGIPLDPGQLTGTVGGSIVWASAYDAVLNRFAFHDPLDGVEGLAEGDLATYLVAGWWSDPARDPLDAARGKESLDELLEKLRWRPVRDWGDQRSEQEYRETQEALRKALGMYSGERFVSERPVSKGARASRATAEPFVPKDTLTTKSAVVAASSFASSAGLQYVAKPWHLRSSLLHGSVYGVPVAGTADVDGRPDTRAMTVALGQHNDDVLAALGLLPGATAAQRRDAERLLEAFTQQKLNRIDSPDGLAEIEETEHGATFANIPSGEVATTDRFAQRVVTGGGGGRKIGRHRVTDRTSERLGAVAPATREFAAEATLRFTRQPELKVMTESETFREMYDKTDDILAAIEPRVVERPAPRWTFATEPLVALRGARRSLRHGGDGRGSPDGKLSCRWPHHLYEEVPGLIAGTDLISTLGNGSVPTEVLRLAREAALHDPYHDDRLALASTPVRAGALPATLVFNRLRAESLLRFGREGTYDGATDVFVGAKAAAVEKQAMAESLRRFSMMKGVDPDLVGVTCWSQPWVPLWLEWEVTAEGVDPDGVDDWELGSVDQEPVGGTHAAPGGSARTITGRSILTTGAATTIRSAVLDYLTAEDARDDAGTGEIGEETEAALAVLAEAVREVDVVTASLSGIRDRLLGFTDAVDGLVRPTSTTGGQAGRAAPTEPPAMLVAGRMRLVRARLVDAFGRHLDVPVANVAVPERATVAGDAGALAVPPRLLRPARWQFRLVDAATPAGAPGIEAKVDQIDTSLQVSPVCGFLLPDHLDETLEFFDADGKPLGEVLHEPVGNGVMWEIAPGREGPPDSGPRFGLTAAQQPLGLLAAGVVAADSAARARRTGDRGESALTALLRAVDTSLWTVDTFATFGAEHIAGLVGRPIAVVRAQLELQVQPTDDVDLSDPARAAEWAQSRASLDRYAFPVRIGELTRTDDGVLGFFVDDDFTHLRIVDKAVAGGALESGRSKGQLGLLGSSSGLPDAQQIDHPYLLGTDDADTLHLHLGQRVTLTLLMHPASRAHLTSGLLPRKYLQLARDWVGPGLAAMAPSLRTGPVLVETDLDADQQVRLPKVSVFGNDQDLWWRDTPATWRHDAILAATQTAFLPTTPAEFREGWVRVAPRPPAPEGGGS